MGEKYTKDFLLKEIAARASFRVSDVRIIMDTFEEIIKEVVENKDELMIGGLFKIHSKKIKPHRGYNLNTKKHQELGTTYRLTITPSTILRNILRESSLED